MTRGLLHIAGAGALFAFAYALSTATAPDAYRAGAWAFAPGTAPAILADVRAWALAQPALAYAGAVAALAALVTWAGQ